MRLGRAQFSAVQHVVVVVVNCTGGGSTVLPPAQSEIKSDLAIEKPLEIPYWNSLCLRSICLFVYICSVMKNKIAKPKAKKFDGLLVMMI